MSKKTGKETKDPQTKYPNTQIPKVLSIASADQLQALCRKPIQCVFRIDG